MNSCSARCGTPLPFNAFHSAVRSTESNAAFMSTYATWSGRHYSSHQPYTSPKIHALLCYVNWEHGYTMHLSSATKLRLVAVTSQATYGEWKMIWFTTPIYIYSVCCYGFMIQHPSFGTRPTLHCWLCNVWHRGMTKVWPRLAWIITVHSMLTTSHNLPIYTKLSSTVYCNRSCLWVCLCVCGSVTTITRNCMHQSSPNWVCR